MINVKFFYYIGWRLSLCNSWSLYSKQLFFIVFYTERYCELHWKNWIILITESQCALAPSPPSQCALLKSSLTDWISRFHC